MTMTLTDKRDAGKTRRVAQADQRTQLAARIARLREDAGLSQTELGRRMHARGFTNWHQTTVSRTEKAERDPSVFEVLALANIFGTTVEAMAGIAPEPVTEYAAGLRHAIDTLTRELEGRTV